MNYRNTPEQYGLVAKCFHSLIATLVLVQCGMIGLKKWFLPQGSPLAKSIIGVWHKPIGLISLVIAALTLIWYLHNPRPKWPATMQAWEKKLATVVHRCLLLSVLLMSIWGLLMSVAAGYAPSFFGLFTLPLFMAKDEKLAHLMSDFHSWTSCCILFFLALHLLAVVKHVFIDKDNVLKRIF